MARGENRDPRRWIRHFRDLKNIREIFPSGSADPGAPQIQAPWMSDTVQLTFPLRADFRVFPVASPAAGADWTLTVPDDVIFRIISIRAQLATAVAVANRAVRCIVTSSSGQFLFNSQASFVQTASQTFQYCFAPFGYDMGTLAGSGFASVPLVQDLWLRQAFTLGMATINLQAADQWSGITALVEAYPNI